MKIDTKTVTKTTTEQVNVFRPSLERGEFIALLNMLARMSFDDMTEFCSKDEALILQKMYFQMQRTVDNEMVVSLDKALATIAEGIRQLDVIEEIVSHGS